VVGPDNPLALGVVDQFQGAGLKIWGPTRLAAQFESSKAFAQDFMQRHGLPTMRAGTFTDAVAASRFAAELGGRCAVKADGLALGKGVLICRDMAQADEAIAALLVERRLVVRAIGSSSRNSSRAPKCRLHALCDGKTMRLFPGSQDHKRAQDNDQGPNTGGMGAYSPAPFLSETDLLAMNRQILDPWLLAVPIRRHRFSRPALPGSHADPAGPENSRVQRPVRRSRDAGLSARLENDLLELLLACVEGNLHTLTLRWRTEAAVCVVMAAAGYPGNVVKGTPIHGLADAASLPHTKVFHAGTAVDGDRVVTNGGRVLGVTAWGPDLAAARNAAYAAVDLIRFEGAQYRRDIAAKALLESRPNVP
jgi:phosphoribosylamine---glycine ligase